MATTQNFYKIKHGLEVPSQDKIQVTTNTGPTIRPSLLLDFANSKQLDPRIDFTRASTGTYYDGKTVAKAEENLLLYSQEFDNAAWTKSNATVTANTTTAPDGTTTAELLVTANGTDGVIFNSTPYISGLSYTTSIFAKKENNNFLLLGFSSAAFPNFNRLGLFDLDTGTVATASHSNINATITSVGNGWYRCSITQTADATISGTVTIAARPTDSLSATGNGTDGVFIWGAQLEQRNSVTAYTPTTDQPITNYIPVLQTASANTARFDHNPVTGESLGLLVEEQRTNLLTYSEDFSNAAWTKNQATIDSNVIIAPDGTLTGDKLVENTDTNTHFVNLSGVTVTLGVAYTMSAFLKKGERTTATLASGSGRLVLTTTFDLDAGTVVSSSASNSTITDVGNGWYRVTATNTVIIATGSLNPSIYIQTNSSYTGDGYSGIYIWGTQLEEGSFPTSYIKTEASQVTRSADSAVMTGTNFSEWYRQDEGTIYAEVITKTEGMNFPQAWSLYTDNSNQMYAYFRTANLEFGFFSESGNSTQANYFTSVDLDRYQKSASSYKTNDYAQSVNGNTVSSDNLGILPRISSFIIANKLNGHIKKLAYFPARLPNETLQALTSSS